MFRFTIRELVLATVIVALGMGWWLDRSRLAKKATEWEGIAVFLANTLLGEKHEVGKPWELEPRLKSRGNLQPTEFGQEAERKPN